MFNLIKFFIHFFAMSIYALKKILIASINFAHSATQVMVPVFTEATLVITVNAYDGHGGDKIKIKWQ